VYFSQKWMRLRTEDDATSFGIYKSRCDEFWTSRTVISIFRCEIMTTLSRRWRADHPGEDNLLLACGSSKYLTHRFEALCILIRPETRNKPAAFVKFVPRVYQYNLTIRC